MITKISKNSLLIFSCISTISFGQLKVLNNGNVGIGVANPIYKSVFSNGVNNLSINPHNAGVDIHSTGNFAPHYQTDFSIYKGNIGSGQLMFTVNSNGNAGIGDANPIWKLTVKNGTGSVNLLNPTSINNAGEMFFITNPQGRIFSINSWGSIQNRKIVEMGVNYAVDGNNGTTRYVETGAKFAPMISMSADDGTVSLFGENGSGSNFRNGNWNLGVYVKNNGNIGIGSTTSNYKMSFGPYVNFKTLALYESGSEFYGLGISNLSFDFWIGNPSASYSFRNPSGAVVAAITSIGDIFQNNSYARNYYYNTSDRRLKNNIVSIDKALDKIAALRGIHYELKDSVDAAFFENTVANADTSKNNKKTPNSSKKTAYGASAPSKTTFGFVAQEIETILPVLVTTSASSVKSVNYIGVIPILVEAMREQQTQIESLKAEVKKLKNTKAGARTEDAKSSIEKTTSIAYLYQNTPNPFSQETTIINIAVI